MTSMRLAGLVMLGSTALAAGASAEPMTYTFDKNHTEVRFCWNHLGVSHQCAHFTNFDGELVFDDAKPEASTLQVTFKTGSIETLVPIFNEHMRSAKLFDAQKFPEASFKSTKFEKTGDKTGKVTGDLTIKGITKPVTLDITLNYEGLHPASKKPSLGIGVSATIKRSEFDLAYGVPAVSDDISLEVQTELNQKS